MASTFAADDLMPTDDDLAYEEELLRSPFSVKGWWRYLQARKGAPPARRRVLFERALAALPGSHKVRDERGSRGGIRGSEGTQTRADPPPLFSFLQLWHAYLTELAAAAAATPPGSPTASSFTATCRRALGSMHKMPSVWEIYLTHVVAQPSITAARRAVDAALRALPVTQHDRVWPLALRLAGEADTPAATARALYRRYLQLEPGHAEEYVAYLTSRSLWREAAERLAACVDDDAFVSVEGKSRHALWLALADVATHHPAACASLRVDAMIRAGIRRLTDGAGALWCALASFHVRAGDYEVARAAYEEGLASVSTVRDFAVVYDALTQFEEALIAHRLEADAADGDAAVDDAAEDSDATTFLLTDRGDDVDLRLARLEALTARRPDLLSAVLLRQNPHNVAEWHRRARLFDGDPAKQIRTYTEAVKTVDAFKTTGKPHTLWLAFARLYEKAGDAASARVVLEKAAAAPYPYVDDAAAVHAAWIEMELRLKRHRAALELARAATAVPAGVKGRDRAAEEAGPVQARLYRSARLWALRVDLEESLGTLETAKAAYEEAMAARVATPAMILNCAAMLVDASHFDAALATYERGVQLFKYPHARELWAGYVRLFLERYGAGGSAGGPARLERARDLFRAAIAAAPADDRAAFYMQHAALEEAAGPPRAAMGVYAAAMVGVPPGARKPVFDAYVSRAASLFGVAKVREVYEAALTADVEAGGLPDADAVAAAQSFAALEARLGEIDRARAVFAHAAPLTDPSTDAGFWDAWHAFEVDAGNEDTFREMLRVRRAVAAARGGGGGAPRAAPTSAPAPAAAGGDAMAALEAAVGGTAVPGFVAGGTVASGGSGAAAAAPPVPTPATNPDEIDIDDVDDAVELAPVPVPAGVFGGVGAGGGVGPAPE